MPLANIEKKFMGHLLHQQSSEPSFLAELLPLNNISREKQLSIYQDNVNGAYQKALSQIYPACMNVLGEEYFNQLCRVYFIKYPSIDADLNVYGEHFSTFMLEQIEQHNELNGLGYLAELADLEWHWHASYYVNNDPVFSFDKLSLVEENEQEKIVFSLSNSFSLHATLYPLLDIWNANKDIVTDNQEFKMPGNLSYFCINRVNYTAKLEVINEEEYILLNNIIDGLPLANISSLDIEIDIQKSIMSFIQKGWITQFEIKL